MIKSLLFLTAFQYIGVPYKWGGNNFDGLDCSGLVVKVFQDLGILKQGEDYSAQGLYNWCKGQQGVQSSIACDSLLFFGRDRNNISHVAISLGEHDGITLMLESAGAGRESIGQTRETLLRRDARVRIKPISHRKDFIEGAIVPYKKIIAYNREF